MLPSLLAQKSWADRELFDAVVDMPSDEQADSRHTAIRTLNHIYVVDKIFLAHLMGEKHGYTATNTPQTPELGELHFAVAQTDVLFENYVATVDGETLAQSLAFQFTDGDTGTMTRQKMLFHVLTHGAYHRGNVGQILKSALIVPPRDLLTKFLHVHEPLRRKSGALQTNYPQV